jgi:hypothetical protein
LQHSASNSQFSRILRIASVQHMLDGVSRILVSHVIEFSRPQAETGGDDMRVPSSGQPTPTSLPGHLVILIRPTAEPATCQRFTTAVVTSGVGSLLSLSSSSPRSGGEDQPAAGRKGFGLTAYGKAGSQLTLRWSEMDSNPRSPV